MDAPRPHRTLRALAAIVAACTALAWCSAAIAAPASGSTDSDEPPADVKIYVPVDKPVLKDAPAKAVDDDALTAERGPETRTEAASQAVAQGADYAINAPFQKLGGAIPVWWVLLGALAIPFALLWRRWTARMFA